MHNVDLFALRIRNYKSLENQRTAHHKGFALCEDGHWYYVKGIGGDYKTCATEWLCTSIAHTLNLPVPQPKVLKTREGELVFGSRSLVGAIPEIECARILSEGLGNLHIDQIQQILSSTFALDLIIGNVDRHNRNFIITETSSHDQQNVGNIHLIDFGHATLIDDTNLPFLEQKNSNTTSLGRQTKNKFGFDFDAAKSLFNRFRHGRVLLYDNAMIGMPDSWMGKQVRQNFRTWFVSNQFQLRINEVENGINDGRYF
jgi:hypothetical protein